MNGYTAQGDDHLSYLCMHYLADLKPHFTVQDLSV